MTVFNSVIFNIFILQLYKHIRNPILAMKTRNHVHEVLGSFIIKSACTWFKASDFSVAEFWKNSTFRAKNIYIFLQLNLPIVKQWYYSTGEIANRQKSKMLWQSRPLPFVSSIPNKGFFQQCISEPSWDRIVTFLMEKNLREHILNFRAGWFDYRVTGKKMIDSFLRPRFLLLIECVPLTSKRHNSRS